jgi:hypothetical protein
VYYSSLLVGTNEQVVFSSLISRSGFLNVVFINPPSPKWNVPTHVYDLDDLIKSRHGQRAEDFLVLFGVCKYGGYFYGFLRTGLMVRVLLNYVKKIAVTKKREV